MNRFIDRFEQYKIPLLENGVRLPVINVSNEERRQVGAPENCNNYTYLYTMKMQRYVFR